MPANNKIPICPALLQSSSCFADGAAIDHSDGILAGTNNYIAEIGGLQSMTVEEFVSRNRNAFV